MLLQFSSADIAYVQWFMEEYFNVTRLHASAVLELLVELPDLAAACLAVEANTPDTERVLADAVLDWLLLTRPVTPPEGYDSWQMPFVVREEEEYHQAFAVTPAQQTSEAEAYAAVFADMMREQAYARNWCYASVVGPPVPALHAPVCVHIPQWGRLDYQGRVFESCATLANGHRALVLEFMLRPTWQRLQFAPQFVGPRGIFVSAQIVDARADADAAVLEPVHVGIIDLSSMSVARVLPAHRAPDRITVVGVRY